MDIIKAEFQKLKKSGTPLMCMLYSLVTISANIYFSVNIQHYKDFDWNWELYLSKILLFACLYAPLFINTLFGYSLIKEYKYKTMEYMIASPIPKYKILLGKQFAMLPVGMLMFLSVVVFSLISGHFLPLGKLPIEFLLFYLEVSALLMILNLIIMTFIIGVSLAVRSQALNITVNICINIILGLLLTTKYRIFFPFCFPSIVTIAAFGHDKFLDIIPVYRGMEGSNFYYALLIFAFSTILFWVIGAYLFRKVEQ